MRQHTSFGAILTLSLTLVTTSATAERIERESSPGHSQHQISHVVVKFRPGAAADDRLLLHRRDGFQIDRTIDQLDMHVIRIPPGKTAEQVVARYARHPLVEFAEPDYVSPPDLTPNDDYYRFAWHLPKIDAPSAWDITTGNPDIIVAILDTGVDGSHPEFVGRLVAGWNVYSDTSNTNDLLGHGTWVAGTVAAASNNSVGVASVAWRCPFMPVRIANAKGWAAASEIAAGLVWAADHGARVANISYVGATTFTTVSVAAEYCDICPSDCDHRCPSQGTDRLRPASRVARSKAFFRPAAQLEVLKQPRTPSEALQAA